MTASNICFYGLKAATFCLAMASASPVALADDSSWAQVTEDELAIKIETDKLEAVIPKRNPKQWMTGIEKQSFLDSHQPPRQQSS